MDFKQIKELITLVNSTELTRVEIEDGDFRLCLQREVKEVNVRPGPVREVVTPGEAVPPQPAVEVRDHLVEVCAPMVGTFYRAPAPDAPPFIQVGESITQGQILFIVEAMKMMNEIESDVSGVVKQVLVENGEPVEYGQPILLIEPKA